jgi:hypothetical protein
MLTPQTVPVVLAQGVDSKTDSRSVVPGKLVRLQNARLTNPGRIRKRFGYDQIGAAPAGSVLASHKGQLFVGTGAEAYSYAASGLVDKGVLESLGVSVLPVRRDAYTQATPDCAVHPLGVSVYTWETSAGGAQYAVFDTATGQPIVSGVALGTTAARPKPIVLGNYVVVVYYETASNLLSFVAIPAAAPLSPHAPATFAANPHTSKVFDAAPIGDRLFLAYRNNSGGASQLSLRYLTTTLTASNEVTISATVGACLGIFGNDTDRDVWVAYYDGSAVKLLAADYGLAGLTLSAATVEKLASVRAVTGTAQGSTATLFYEVSAAQTYNTRVRAATATIGGTVSGVKSLLRSVGLASKPFRAAGRIHLLVAHQSVLQPTYFLATESGAIVGKLAAGVGGGLTSSPMLPEAAEGAGAVSIAYLQADRIGSQGGTVFAQVGVMAASFDVAASPSTVELSDDLHISGGMLAMYDGAQVCEHGFHLYPENVTAAASGTGVFNGQYQIAVLYEWMDGYGLLHRSAPSVPVTVAATNAAQFDIVIPTLRLTDKATPVSVVVYRTEANQAIFYRSTSIGSPLLNSKTADTVSFTDSVADATLTGHEQLYTTGGEVENIAAPAPSFVTSYRNRAIVIAAESPLEWWFSKQVTPGVPAEFSDVLYATVEAEGGGLTGAIQMDDKLVLFKRSKVYYVVGSGPSANGLNNDYSDPLPVPTDCGCVNPRSLVLTPAGVMFQSAKGICLLGRDLSVSYVGADVEAWNDATVTSARLIPNTREVRFTLDTGEILVFDTYVRQWMTDTRLAAVDSAIFGGLFTFLAADGKIKQERPGSFTDAGEPILIALTTSVLSFAGISGYQRVWKVVIRGDYRSPHRLTVRIASDDSPAAEQNASVDTATILAPGALGGSTFDADTEDPGGGRFPPYVWAVGLVKQKCSSVQIAIEESQSGPEYGEGLSLAALTFEVGIARGTTRVPADRSFG